jgi:hypothetical protein
VEVETNIPEDADLGSYYYKNKRCRGFTDGITFKKKKARRNSIHLGTNFYQQFG